MSPRTPGRRGAPGRAALSYVTLGVKDLGRAVRFYRQVLRLAPVQRGTMAILALGPVRLALLPHAALAREAGLARRGGGTRSVLLSLNLGRRDEVAALLRRAAAAGGRIVRPAAAASWGSEAGGGETGVFADPDGHLWEVAWNPAFRFSGSGLRRGSPRPARRSR